MLLAKFVVLLVSALLKQINTRHAFDVMDRPISRFVTVAAYGPVRVYNS
jgi:hypothetical protein